MSGSGAVRERGADNLQHTMKKSLLILALGLSAFTLSAQDSDAPPRPEGRPGGPGGRPQSPLFAAIDTNKDGKLDAGEIANAANSLKTLDKNGDGEISQDEVRGPRPGGGPGGGPGQRPSKSAQ